MSITSIFIPNSTSFINNPYYLENLLTTYQTKFKSYDQSVIISLSYVINTVDTLSVLNFLINKKIQVLYWIQFIFIGKIRLIMKKS